MPTPPAVSGNDADPGGDLLGEVARRLEPFLRPLVDELHEWLTVNPAQDEVVRLLTPDQIDHLKLRQVEHLRLLLSPSADLQQTRARSRQVGRILSMVGVETDWYVDALTEHRNRLLHTLRAHGADLDLAQAQLLVTDRFTTDLQGQLLGMRDQDDAQSKVMLRVLDAVADAHTVADLGRGVADALGGLEGMAVCMFGRQGSAGVMATEAGAGPGFESMIAEAARRAPPPVTTSAWEPNGQGTVGQAWRSGEITRCDSLRTDPGAAPWQEFARRLGWGASAAVPLVDRHGRPRALLSMQAYWPGYFGSAGRMMMFEQVRRVTERALNELEERPALASGVSTYAARAHHLDLLGQDKVLMLFQPLVRLPSGELSKLEALARLQDGGQLVSPAGFLSAFGDRELLQLFDVGLRQALEALLTWETQGLSTGVSVNLPVSAAHDGRYVTRVSDLLDEYGVDPSRLTLELLETGLMEREGLQRRHSMDQLKELGVRLAQDDLGSGYSSLLRLRHFAFDEVKIDRGLVQGSGGVSGAALHFIKPINSIAHSLGLKVVIEGLEDDGLIEAAVQLGVDEGQGFGIARPMPAEDVVAWARGHRLDIDPAAPRTPVGGLAAHVAWEHRLASLPRLEDRLPLLDMGSCGLTSYVRDQQRSDLTEAHHAAHAAALAGHGSGDHRARWQHLSAVVARPRPATS